MKLLLIIPAHNEQENIERVVDNLIQNYPQYDYVVINDGSDDETLEICHKRGYRVIDLPINLGLGGAVRTGMLLAKEKGYDAALQFDADGQHRAEYIAAMLKEMQEKNSDIVIGSRFAVAKKPRTLRMVGSYFISWTLRLVCGSTICDPTSGMRLFSKRAIKLFVDNKHLIPEPDALCFFKKQGYKITETQVTMDERTAGESYLTLWKSIRYMIRVMIAIILT